MEVIHNTPSLFRRHQVIDGSRLMNDHLQRRNYLTLAQLILIRNSLVLAIDWTENVLIYNHQLLHTVIKEIFSVPYDYCICYWTMPIKISHPHIKGTNWYIYFKSYVLPNGMLPFQLLWDVIIEYCQLLERLIPVAITGFSELKKREKLQEQETLQHQKRLSVS